MSLKLLYEVLVNSYHTSNVNDYLIYLGGWGGGLAVLSVLIKYFPIIHYFNGEMLQTKQVPSVSMLYIFISILLSPCPTFTHVKILT